MSNGTQHESALKGIPPEGLYDARTLGKGKMTVLGLQHMFAMFGATVLVPLLTGLSVSATLLFAGIGTLMFHFLTKKKVPAFLGSSFAFIAGYAAIAPNGEADLLPYACLGVFFAGFVYLILAALFKGFGPKRVMRYFPPVVTGPIVISIGLILAGTAITNCESCWPIAILAIVVIIICNIFGKGMVKVVPILLGVIVSYVVAGIASQTVAPGLVDFSGVAEAPWIGLPVLWDNTVFATFGNFNSGLAITAIITIVPLAFATVIEHIGDITAIGSTCNRNYIADPGLHRTLLGDGLATMVASLFGAPANTTYGENTGVLALTRVFDPRVIRIAACFAIAFSFCPKFAAIIQAIPASVIGGVSLVLYGMISGVGIRNLIENKTDLQKSRNVLVVALVLVLSLGISYTGTGSIDFVVNGVTIGLSGLAVGSLIGILLNAILPGKDYEFDDYLAEEQALDTISTTAALEAAGAGEAGIVSSPEGSLSGSSGEATSGSEDETTSGSTEGSHPDSHDSPTETPIDSESGETESDGNEDGNPD
jgi:uracil permease